MTTNSSGQPNLVLAGFMGTGKSTVGQLLAHTLGMPFLDTDRVIEKEANLTVAQIFAGHGEATFRAWERDVCHKVVSTSGQVVALGGGALLDPGNRASVERAGVIVLLRCHPDVLVQRLTESAKRGERPLLLADIRETISRLLTEREPVYSAIQQQVDTTELTPEEVAGRVLALYEHAIEHSLQEARQ